MLTCTTTQRIRAAFDLDRVTKGRAMPSKQSRVLLIAKLVKRAALCGLTRETDLVGLPTNRHH